MQYPTPKDTIRDLGKWKHIKEQLPDLPAVDPSKPTLSKREIRALTKGAKPKTPPTNHKDYKALRAKWDAILAADGFEDIETPSNGFGERDSPFLRRHSLHTLDAITKGERYSRDLLRAFEESSARQSGKAQAPTPFERDCLSLYLRGWRESEVANLLAVDTKWVHEALSALLSRARAFAKKHLPQTQGEYTSEEDNLSAQVAQEFIEASGHVFDVGTSAIPTDVDEYDDEFKPSDNTPWEHFWQQPQQPKPTKKGNRKADKGKARSK